MIAQTEPKLVAGFRDGRRDIYRLVDEYGAAMVCQAGFKDVVSVEKARAVNAALTRRKPKPNQTKPMLHDLTSAAAEKVLVWIKQNPGPHELPVIRVASGIKKRYAKAALIDLVQRGQVSYLGPSRTHKQRWQARATEADCRIQGWYRAASKLSRTHSIVADMGLTINRFASPIPAKFQRGFHCAVACVFVSAKRDFEAQHEYAAANLTGLHNTEVDRLMREIRRLEALVGMRGGK